MHKSTMVKIAALAIATVMLLACAGTTNTYEKKESEMSKREKAVALIHSIETGDHGAVSYINANNYTQHNLSVADGIAGFGEVLAQLPKGSAKAKVIRAIEDGDYVFTHTDYNFFGPKVGFDIFRFEDGLIVEHWDNLTVKAEQLNPSDRTELDGPLTIEDLDKTEANKQLVADFIDRVLIGGQFDKLTDYISTEMYHQHNTQIADGLDGLGASIEAMAAQGITMVYTNNHMVLGEGNFVLTVSEGTLGGNHTSYYDLFRVKDGKIVEHWDVIETIPPESEWKNSNGKF